MNRSAQKKIIWLASYPKSGNTWFRAFLTALLDDGELDINQMKTDGIFSSKPLLENYTDLEPSYLYDNEAKQLQGEVFTYLESVLQKENLFIKIHDAYTYKDDGQPLVPSECTRCAIYFIRNPLDIVGSFASHLDSTIDDAVNRMNNPKGALAAQTNNNNVVNQFKQLLLSWSGHVVSWTGDLPFPVMVLKYEDMIADTYTVFSKALVFMGIEATTEQILTAIEASNFEQLQKKEQEAGFFEKHAGTQLFFRKGQAGNWKTELNDIQIANIIENHKNIMMRYNYL
jgi:hypothetical protein